MPPSCTFRRDGSASGLHNTRRRVTPGQVRPPCLLGLGQLHGRRARCGLRLTRLARPGRAAAPAVDEQAVHRVRHAVKCGPHRRQVPERLPPLVAGKQDLEQNAVLCHVPFPVCGTVCDGGLSQRVLMGIPPRPRGQRLRIEDLDRPPFRHASLLCKRDSTSLFADWVGSFAVRGMRQALSLLTVLPVGSAGAPGPSVMAYAPLVGVLLGGLGAGVLAVAAWAAGPLVAGAVAVAVLALMTRGLHLDGLADLADGLGSGKPANGALDIMRRPDIGPMGVVTVVLALLLQVTALARAASVSQWHGVAALVTAVVTGRLAMTWACRTGVPAARPGGLG